MSSDPLDPVRQDLAALRSRFARGELDRAEYQAQRELILADLTPEERAALGTASPAPGSVTPPASTPPPSTPRPSTPAALGPSGARGSGLRTSIPTLADLGLSAGTVLLGQWRLARELGRGGFGAVFEAEELHLHERQAVKVLDPAMVAKEELLARFRREVSLMRKLVHPRIVRVYDYREDPEQLVALISMELVPGGPVKQLLTLAREKREPIPIALALEILHQTLEALAEAHWQGVIHRDVTPGNVLLAGGSPEELLNQPSRDPQVKLVDFGIAGLVERSELSQKSRVLGTAAYVAPEVLDPAAEITPAADVYGAGAIAYELLTGRLPLGRFAEPARLRPELPAALDAFVLELLDPQPQARPRADVGLARLLRLMEEQLRQTAPWREAEKRARHDEEARLRREAELNRQGAEAAQHEVERRRAEEHSRLQAQQQGLRRVAEQEAQRDEAIEGEQERREAQIRLQRRHEAARQLRLEQAQKDAQGDEEKRARKAERAQQKREAEKLAGIQAGRRTVARPKGLLRTLLLLSIGLTAILWVASAYFTSQRDAEAPAQRKREEAVRARAQPSDTWRDERTGLLWTARDNGSDINWYNAKSYCENLTLEGHFSGWRLPSIGELEGRYDAASSKWQKTQGAVELTNSWVWSGNLKPDDSSAAWYFAFVDGKRSWLRTDYVLGLRALCVRRSGE